MNQIHSFNVVLFFVMSCYDQFLISYDFGAVLVTKELLKCVEELHIVTIIWHLEVLANLLKKIFQSRGTIQFIWRLRSDKVASSLYFSRGCIQRGPVF